MVYVNHENVMAAEDQNMVLRVDMGLVADDEKVGIPSRVRSSLSNVIKDVINFFGVLLSKRIASGITRMPFTCC
jgi:hypothetical protein